MAIVIELIGGRGIGKSKLISKLKEAYPNIISREGFRRNTNNIDLDQYDNFIEHEKEYLQLEIDDLNNYKKIDGLVILTRGPHECLMYIDYYVERFHQDWNYKDELKSLSDKLLSLASKNIIYLDASRSYLQKAVDNDPLKRRKNIDFWLDFNEYEKEKLLANNNVYYLDVENLTESELYQKILYYIDNIKEEL